MTHVEKSYRTAHVETRALRDFSLEVRRGEFVAVMGPSGSGKTTFLHVAGLLEPLDSGRYELEGRDTSALSDNARSRLRNERIGFIFQNFNLLAELDVFGNVELPLLYRGVRRAERRERVGRALELVGLTRRARHPPSQLSGGQQQRVAIARALVGEPSLLLADEPTGNLDSTMAQQVMALLGQVHRMGTTLIMVTHDPQLARRADRLIRIVDGRLLGGSPAGTAAWPPAGTPVRSPAETAEGVPVDAAADGSPLLGGKES